MATSTSIQPSDSRVKKLTSISILSVRCFFVMSIVARSLLRPRAQTCHCLFYKRRARRCQSDTPDTRQQLPYRVQTPPFIQTVRDAPSNDGGQNHAGSRQLTSRRHGATSSNFSPILLRDMCACPACVDGSTRQKLFSTAEIPENITVRDMNSESDSVRITWENDIPGSPSDHETVLPKEQLKSLTRGNSPVQAPFLPRRTVWNAELFSESSSDIRYDDYMQDDATLHRAVQQLHRIGLLFLTHVPDSPESVASIAERIGPLKDTCKKA